MVVGFTSWLLAASLLIAGVYAAPQLAYLLTNREKIVLPVHDDSVHAVHLWKSGQLEQAVAEFQAVALHPQLPSLHRAVAWFHLGGLYLELRQIREAAEAFEKAMLADVPFAPAFNSYGMIAIQSDLDAALRAFREALRLDPGFAEAANNAGCAAIDLSDGASQAITLFTRAIALAPTVPHYPANLGHVLLELNRTDEAARWHRTAATLSLQAATARAGPAQASVLKADTLLALGTYWEAMGEFDIALDALTALWHQRSHRHECSAHHVGGLALLYQMHRQTCSWASDSERPGSGVRASDVVHALRQCTDHGFDVTAIDPYDVLGYPFSAAQHLTVVAQHAAQVMAATTAVAVFSHDLGLAGPASGPRLRVGYLSADWGDHVTAHLLQDVFAAHDPQRVEVFCFSVMAHPPDSVLFRRIRGMVGRRFIDVSDISDADAAQQINVLGIHVLLDANYRKNARHSGARNEIIAARPAAVQVNFLAYCGSSGQPFIDWIASDRLSAPPDLASLFSERLLLLPTHYQVNAHQSSYRLPPLSSVTGHHHNGSHDDDDDDDDDSTLAARRAFGLPPTGFLFANFGQAYKIEEGIFAVWLRVLARVPGSQLCLVRYVTEAAEEDYAYLQRRAALVEGHLRRRAAQELVDPTRIHFLELLHVEAHLLRAKVLGLYVDTLAYNSHTSAVDVLWAGLPVVTTAGEKMASRVAASLLHSVDSAEIVARNLQDYEDLVVRIGTHRTLAAALEAKLHARRISSALFHTAEWVAVWESALRSLFEAFLEQPERLPHVFLPLAPL